MPVFDVPVDRAVEKGLIDPALLSHSIQYPHVTDEAQSWLKKYCGPVGGINILNVQWFSEDFDFSYRVVYRPSTGKRYVRVVIPNARHAMLFKLTWM